MKIKSFAKKKLISTIFRLLRICYNIRIIILRPFLGSECIIYIIRNTFFDELRIYYLIKYGAKIAPTAKIRRGFYAHCAQGKTPFENLNIGDNVYIDKDVLIDLSSKFTIGRNSRIACGVKIYTHFASHYRGSQYNEYVKAPVSIGKDSRCSPNSIIACGVKVGNKVLIGAGSFIKAYSILEDNSFYGGIPGKKIKKYE